MPSTLRLLVCAGGIYASFLSWALVQERLSTTPYGNELPPRYFRHVVFLNTVQSCFSACAALLYMLYKCPRNASWLAMLGLTDEIAPNKTTSAVSSTPTASRTKNVLARCAQCALMASIGSPFGYAALRYIDYPTQILGKSCKLVPVMLMNIILYRRKFALHKYVVVGTVTAGISLFMLYAPSAGGHGAKKGAATNSLLGVGLLLVNLLVDGAINSTQDEVFVQHKIQGIQMMFLMNSFATLITTFSMLVPFPAIPIISPAPAAGSAIVRHSELSSALEFISSHPQVLKDILLFSTAGALGQLFIFDTLENFGSLTLVTITVTRKLFTMLLSLVVYNHRLTVGQWAGVVTVFAGIGIEAYVKRTEALEKKRRKLERLRKDAGLSVPHANGQSNGHASGSVTPVRLKDI